MSNDLYGVLREHRVENRRFRAIQPVATSTPVSGCRTSSASSVYSGQDSPVSLSSSRSSSGADWDVALRWRLHRASSATSSSSIVSRLYTWDRAVKSNPHTPPSTFRSRLGSLSFPKNESPDLSVDEVCFSQVRPLSVSGGHGGLYSAQLWSGSLSIPVLMKRAPVSEFLNMKYIQNNTKSELSSFLPHIYGTMPCEGDSGHVWMVMTQFSGHTIHDIKLAGKPKHVRAPKGSSAIVSQNEVKYTGRRKSWLSWIGQRFASWISDHLQPQPVHRRTASKLLNRILAFAKSDETIKQMIDLQLEGLSPQLKLKGLVQLRFQITQLLAALSRSNVVPIGASVLIIRSEDTWGYPIFNLKLIDMAHVVGSESLDSSILYCCPDDYRYYRESVQTALDQLLKIVDNVWQNVVRVTPLSPQTQAALAVNPVEKLDISELVDSAIPRCDWPSESDRLAWANYIKSHIQAYIDDKAHGPNRFLADSDRISAFVTHLGKLEDAQVEFLKRVFARFDAAQVLQQSDSEV